MSDTTTRLVNAFNQTDDEAVFQRAVIRILADEYLPAYREQGEQIAAALNRKDILRALLQEMTDAYAVLAAEAHDEYHGGHGGDCLDCEASLDLVRRARETLAP